MSAATRGLTILLLLLVVSGAVQAGDFPKRFRVTCPQLLEVPHTHPDKLKFEQACLDLSQTEFSLVAEGENWRLTPPQSSDLADVDLWTPSSFFHPHGCIGKQYVGAICAVPVGLRIKIPGMGSDGWVKSKYGLIMIINLLGVFDLKPVEGIQFN